MGALANWRVILGVLAVLVLGGSVFLLTRGDRIEQPNKLTAVDVKTGEIIYFDVGGRAGAMWPELNPDTMEPTLYRVDKEEDGTWRVRDRMMERLGQLRQNEPGVELMVDESGRVLGDPGGPSRTIKAGDAFKRRARNT